MGKALLVALLEVFRPVLDPSCQEARKDEVKGRGVGPVIFHVIDEERRVGWDTIRVCKPLFL